MVCVCLCVSVCACYVAQSDPEGPIRVNTVILLGRIAPLLRADTRDAVRTGDGCQHATHAHNVNVACVHVCVAVAVWLCHCMQEVMGAFAKAMRDPFGHVRLAAVRGIQATYKGFNSVVRQ